MRLRCSDPSKDLLLPAHIGRRHRLRSPGILLPGGLAWILERSRSLGWQHCPGALFPLIALVALAALVVPVALVDLVAPVPVEISK